MDIMKLLPENLPPLFSFQTSELGKLYCFTLRAKDWEQLSKKHTEALSDDEWVRALISVSCNKEESLKDGQYKPDDGALSDDDVSRLDRNELEVFADNYTTNSQSLKEYSNDDKQKKADDESNVIYLRRIYNHHRSNLATTKLSKDIERSIAGSKSAFEALSQFKSLASATRATDILSASTLESIAKLRDQESAMMKNWQPHLSPPPNIPLSPQISAAKESALHLEDLKNLMLASNEVQAGIRKDITNAIADSRNVSRWNLIISGSVLILTLAGLWLTYSNAQSNGEQMDRFMKQMTENSSAVVKPMESLSSSVNTASEKNDRLAAAIESLGTEVQMLREEQKDQKTSHQIESGLDKSVKKVQ